MASAFDIELPFPIRKARRSRLSVGDVKMYSDIALTKGHAGNGLQGARDAFCMGAVEAGKLADIMRQVDVSAAGSLRRHDFSLALDRAGMSLSVEDTDNLFRSLTSANRGRGCDIEMFAHLVNFWARNDRDESPVTLAAGGRELPSERDHSRVSQTEHSPPPYKAPGNSNFDDTSRSNHAAGLRDLTAGEGEVFDGGRRSIGAENGKDANAPNGRIDPLDGRGGGRYASPEPECGTAAAGRRNSFAVNMTDIFNHAAPARDGRTYAPRHGRAHAPEPAAGGGDSVGTPTELARDYDGRGGAGDARSSAAKALVLDTGVAREDEAKPPDEAYMHSLGYGNLGSLLPILLDRRAALEASLERLDRGGTGKVRPGDFMAAVRQVGIALSVVQEGNMMDLLGRMGALTSGEEGSDWVDARAGVAAVALAGEKAGGRFFLVQEKPRSFLEEGTRLLDAVSDQYADVHLSLLPSSILLGPNALRERRSAADDGANNVFVTAGSLRKALRNAGVLLGDADDRVLWRLLLRRAQVVHGRSKADGKEHAHGEDTNRFLERGIIPLPLLDDVMGFNADEALRTRRQLQQQEAHPATSVSAPFRDHLGPWAAPVAHNKIQGEGGEIDDAPLLLQKARLRVKALGDTVPERSQLLMAYLPKLGPTGERQTLPRREVTRLLQELRVGVRSGELQNLWYHMDRNKVSREGFRRILLEATDSLHVTFPASPCPYPAGPVTPTSHVSYGGDSTPVGGVSVSGAKLQRVLNRAAYEENVRRAAGSALTYGVQETEDTGQALASSPSRPSSKDNLPVLLERAVKRVREMDSGQEAVSALVPDMGRAKEGMRITRGGVQRVLHGLGVVPRSGELQQLWWSLEKGVVGDPRITVEAFRDVLLGRTTKLALLPDWTAQGTTRGGHEGQRSSDASDGGDGSCESPGARVVREVRTALGLVRRRVRGVIRGCEDRDLTADGWVAEEAFLAVLREQGILQQLGNTGLSALRRAIAMEADRDKRNAPTSVVRYTGLVGAIDSYLDTLISWDTAGVALRLGSDGEGGENTDGKLPSGYRKESRGEDGGMAIQTSPTPHSNRNFNGRQGDRSPTSPTEQPPLGPRSAKKTDHVKVSQNSVARAARGWDDDPPVAPLGMRHYPQKNCSMATLVGGRAISDRAAVSKVVHERERKPRAGGVGTSTGMTGALHWRDTAPAPPSSADTANPRQPRPSSPSAVPGMPPSPAWGRGNDASAPDCSPIPMERPQSGSGHRNGSAERARFVPAGGSSGLGRPAWSSGRRGSEGAMYSMAGGGVSRAICWEREGEPESQQEYPVAVPAVPINRDSDHRCSSPGNRSDADYHDGHHGREGGAAEGPGEAGHMKVPLSGHHRRHSRTGGMRELTEAWPETADQRTDRTKVDIATARRPVLQHSEGKNPRKISESRKNAAKALLSDRALLAGVFRQLAGVGGPQARDGLDRAEMVKLLRYPRLPSHLSEEEAEDLADAALCHCGTSTMRFSSLTTFLANTAGSVDAPASPPFEGVPVDRGSSDNAWDIAASRRPRALGDDPIAQSIKRNIEQGRSELRLAGKDAEGRLSCAVHLRRAFRKRRKNLGGDPGGVDDCSVETSDLTGVLQDMGVILSPTETAFLIKKCRAQSIPGRRPATGGSDAAPVRAGDVLGFFTELLTAH